MNEESSPHRVRKDPPSAHPPTTTTAAKRPRLHDNDNNYEEMSSSINNQLTADELCHVTEDVVTLPALPDISQDDFNNHHGNDDEELMGVSMAQLNASIDVDTTNTASYSIEGQKKAAKTPRKSNTTKKPSSSTNSPQSASSGKRNRRASIMGTFITYSEYATQLQGGLRNSHPPLLDQYLTWQNGKIYCMCCGDIRIGLKKHMYRHTLSPSHIENLAKMKEKEAARPTQGLPTTEKEGYISYEEYFTQLNGGVRNKHPPIIDQCLTWREGKVFCMCCNNIQIGLRKHLFRHTQSASHKKNLERAKVTKMPLHQDIIGSEDTIENYITYGDYLTQLRGGDRNAHPNLEDQYLTWENGKIRCMCCNTRIKHKKHMYRHTLNPTHRTKLEKVRSGEMQPFLEPPEDKAAREAAKKKAEKDALEKGYITWNNYVTQVKGGKRNGHPSIEDQGLKWEDGKVSCTVCNIKIGLKKHFYRHTQSANHKKLLEEAKSNGASLHQDILLLQQQIDDQAVAESLTDMAASKPDKFFITDTEVAEMKKTKRTPTKRGEGVEYISHKRYLAQLKGGLRNSHPSIEDQGLTWQDGKVHCTYCKVEVGLKKHMYRHTQTTRHKRKMERAKNGEMDAHDSSPQLEDRCVVVDSTNSEVNQNNSEVDHAATSLKSEVETGSIAFSESTSTEGAAMKTAATVLTQDDIGVKGQDGYISFVEYLTQLKGGKRKSHPSIEDQGLKWENGKIHCTCCDMKIGLKKHMYRHTQTALHKKMRDLTRAVQQSLQPARGSQVGGTATSNSTTDATVTSTTKLLGDFINQTSPKKPSSSTPIKPVKDFKRGKTEGDDYIPYEEYVVQLKGGARNSRPSIEDQGLTWKDGKVICTCCNVRIGLKKHMYRHTQTALHFRNLARARLTEVPREQVQVDNAAAKDTTEATNNAAAKSTTTEAVNNTVAKATIEATNNATDNLNVPIETIGYNV